MVYGQLRTLISLLIVIGLGVAFLWGGSRVLGTLTGTAAPPLATATPRPVVEQPTVVAPSLPTRRPSAAGRGSHPVPVQAAPVKTPTPHPSPTPNVPPKVIVTSSLSDSRGASVFKVGPQLTEMYCRVRNGALPPGTPAVTITWSRDEPGGELSQYSVARYSGADFTTGYYLYPAQAPGKYRCDVTINGQTFGSARFSVRP